MFYIKYQIDLVAISFVKNILQVIPDEMIHGVRIKQTEFTFPWLAD